MLTKKGIIFTLDAMIALIIAVTIITGVIFYLGQVSKVPHSRHALNRIAQDSLTILEKDGSLKQALEASSNATIITFISSLPRQICAKIDLKARDQSTIQSIARIGCVSSDETVIVRRVFIANGLNPYYARAEFWYITQ